MIFTLDTGLPGELTVFFPYEYVYKEQLQYMLELKRALDAKGDAILEMPTGTGKTVCLLALITSYQYAKPETGNLIYCTRTVPEMAKTMAELARVVDYRASALAAAGAADTGKILGVCLSSRRNLCIHPGVADAEDKEGVDAGCRNLTASWVRKAGASDPSVPLCSFFEGLDSACGGGDAPAPPGVTPTCSRCT